MSAEAIFSYFGEDLTPNDLENLEKRWINREGALEAGLRRVDSYTGRSMFSRKNGDFAGIIIPNVLPGEKHVREWRMRRDRGDLVQSMDGTVKEQQKYIGPTNRPNLVFFPPGLPESLLPDIGTPVVITEGEFKCLSLWRLAKHRSDSARFLPISVSGVHCFRGTIGKTVGPDGDRRDVKGTLPDFSRITWNGRKVVIAYDADAESNPKVRAARAQLAGVLIGLGATVGFLEWPITEGKGIDDRLDAVGPDRVLAELAALEYGDWNTRLLRNDEGRIISCYDNVAMFIENSPEWHGVLGYNEFTGGYSILNTPPSPVSAEPGAEIEDHFDTEVVRWLERKRLMVKPDLVRRVIDVVGRRNSFHPVRDYLDKLKWDGTPRIGTWLIDYCGVASSDESPNRYAEAVGEKFLISAVARIYQPGCKVDYTPILEGDQGIGKSRLVRTLAGDEHFTDQIAELGSKDASMQLRGVWIAELQELDALNRADMARVKAFLTQQTERFRLPYGRRIVQVPRQCVFIGTTNADSWLKDETGGRRFWPVRCGVIDIDSVRRDRDQLWAEALQRYRSGANWWLEDAATIRDATEEQRGRFVEDVWHDPVIEHAEDISGSKQGASITEILRRLGIDVAKQDQVAANRVQRCLRAAGWERFKKRLPKDELSPTGKAFEWRYRKAGM